MISSEALDYVISLKLKKMKEIRFFLNYSRC
jgi:hypothetical protein